MRSPGDCAAEKREAQKKTGYFIVNKVFVNMSRDVRWTEAAKPGTRCVRQLTSDRALFRLHFARA